MTIPASHSPAPAEAPSAPLLDVQDVSITHPGADAATPANVSFTLRKGEVALLLGPSGSGKSTLTLAMNGLIPHEVPATMLGTVSIDGTSTAETPVAHLSTRVGMVFQDPDAQLVTGSVRDEVAFGPENLRLPVAEVLARSEAALRRVGLWEQRDANPDVLSGGGKQRLALACALAMQSALLVLDEPTANLDPQGAEALYEALTELTKEREHAILLVEHNLDSAVNLVSRVIVLDHTGHIVMDGGVDQVIRHSAERLVTLGVWLPTATLAAMTLRDAGYPIDPLPLTAAELRAALERMPTPRGPAALAPAHPTLARSRAAQPVITVQNLTMERGRRLTRKRVLHDVSLQVSRGEFVAIIGANGAGKTTLAQTIAGVLTPPRGRVHVAGTDVARADARELSARIGFVFQNPEHQFITHTVFDEIAHGLRLQRVSEDEVRERTNKLLARFELIDRADAHPFHLSGGQKRRLSVGTALVGGAEVLVLDEPTFGQDRARAEELLALLAALRDTGTTVLIVSHDMQLVAEHADRVIALSKGTVAFDGDTRTLLADADAMSRQGLRRPVLCDSFPAGWPAFIRLSDLPGGTP